MSGSTSSVGPSVSVVAIGGGHGLAATLRAVRRYADSITAVVSVADNGGSSGRLRDTLGLPPPGDIRKCLGALADPNSMLANALEYRFDTGELKGHTLGNLLIAGLTEFCGDFVAALDETARLLGACGRVLPATSVPVVLKAVDVHSFGIPTQVEGQVQIAATTRILEVSHLPENPPVEAGVIKALQDADQIVIGPGSLYTSVLAVVGIPTIRESLVGSNAQTVYVANLRTQVPETANYDVGAHVRALLAHGIKPDTVLCDSTHIALGDIPCNFINTALAADELPGSHDPVKLATALKDLLNSQ